MRHRKKKHKLGVSGPHRTALLANLSIALITHGRIRTTLAKAKALRPFVEKIITLAKKANGANEPERKLHFRRLAIARLNNPTAVAKLFDERVEEFLERPGGYTRIYKLGQRIGDAAEMALIELIDADDEGYSKRSSRKTGKKAKKADATNEVVAEEAATTDAPQPEAAVEVEADASTDETAVVEADEIHESPAKEDAPEETESEEVKAEPNADKPEPAEETEPEAAESEPEEEEKS